MTNANNLSESQIDLSDREREIVEYFVRGQKRALSSEHLKLEFTETSIRLSVDFVDANGKRNTSLLGISKQTNQWQRKVLVGLKSPYRQILLDALAENRFITKDRSSHPEFTEHHYYTFPDAYRLNYAEAMQLWRIWWHHKRYRLNSPGSPIDARIFNKGNWYPVEDLQPKQGKFLIQIGRGLLTVEPEEFLVWIAREDGESDITNNSAEKLFAQSKAGEVLPRSRQKTIFSAHPLDRRHPAKVTAESPTDPDRLEMEVDLESYLSTFNTEDSEDIDRIEGIYNIDELLGRADLGNDETEPDPVPTPTVTIPLVTTVQVEEQPETMPPSPQAEALPVAELTPALDRVEEPEEAPAVRVEESSPTTEDLSVPSQQPESSELQPPVRDPLSAIAPVSPPLPSSAEQRRADLKRRTLKVLAKYLQEGDRTIHTEVLKNAQGEEINRKTIEIRRGCPQWAIEQIIKLQQQ